jgi:hypothetical protein
MNNYSEKTRLKKNIFFGQTRLSLCETKKNSEFLEIIIYQNSIFSKRLIPSAIFTVWGALTYAVFIRALLSAVLPLFLTVFFALALLFILSYWIGFICSQLHHYFAEVLIEIKGTTIKVSHSLFGRTYQTMQCQTSKLVTISIVNDRLNASFSKNPENFNMSFVTAEKEIRVARSLKKSEYVQLVGEIYSWLHVKGIWFS